MNRRSRARRAFGLGRSPTGSGSAGAAARQNFYKARERRQKLTLAAIGAGVAYKAGRAVHKRRKARKGKQRRDANGKFT